VVDPSNGSAHSRFSGLNKTALEDIMYRIVRAIVEDTEAQGFFGFDLVKSVSGRPRILGFKSTLSDPEAQVILPRLKSELFPLLLRVASRGGFQENTRLKWHDYFLDCLPVYNDSDNVRTIEGIQKAERTEGDKVFHCCTKLDRGIALVTTGRRALSVSSLGRTLDQAKERALEGTQMIRFEEYDPWRIAVAPVAR
jgi:phosphoribosylamine--glycine ligase